MKSTPRIMDGADEELGRQLELPLSREDKLRLLARFRRREFALLSRTMRDNVADLVEQVELLATGNGGCRCEREVIAARVNGGKGINIRTLTRWSAAAAELMVLRIEQGRSEDGLRAVNSYFVEWENVRRHGQGLFSTMPKQADAAVQPYASPGREELDGDTLDPLTNGGGDVHEPGSDPIRGAVSAESRPTADRSVPPVGTNVPPVGTNVPPVGTFFRGGGLGGALPLTPTVLYKDPNTSPTPHSSAHLRRDNCPAGRDRFPVSAELLGQAHRIDEWFDWATARNWVFPSIKLHVFATARSIFRRRAALQNPGGAFVSVVKQRLWTRKDIFSRADEEWARQALLELERGDSL